ncbi:prepilin-type N-terminal cleavage/methylation domain-containing protein [Candidatus Woesebacteria bacterium]|nr:prepilin-type N-terminal cleavage/methylation domain-containing protein [Candidatus Woesebacteria bacterium]
MPKIKSKNNTGFTLIELLIVIAILGLLATITIISFTGAPARARDARRKGDLRQYQASLIAFAAKYKGFYPTHVSPTDLTTMCSSTELNIANCPNDPKEGSYHYYYLSNGSTSPDATDFVVWAIFENPSSPITYWVLCSNGINGTTTTSPDSSTCPSGLVP